MVSWRNPDHYVIAATYAQELADDFGRKVRNQIADPLSAEYFPACRCAPTATSAGASTSLAMAFHHQAGWHFTSQGIGGPITGRGAHPLLIDDPVKNREDADSEVIRDKTKARYTSTAYTRLTPGGRIIIIQTRWHEDDPSGWLLEDHRHEGWEALNLPAIDDAGKALWPEQYDIPALEKIRLAIGPRDWSALYQQRPSPESGNYFKAEWLRPTTSCRLVQPLNVYGASDYAVTADGGDYTVHVVVGIDPEGRMYLWTRGAASPRPTRGFPPSATWSEMAPDRLGRGNGADQVRRRVVHRRHDAGEQGVRVPRGVPNARRQGDPGSIDPRPHGDERALTHVQPGAVPGRPVSEMMSFRSACMTTRSTRWGWSGSCWTECRGLRSRSRSQAVLSAGHHLPAARRSRRIQRGSRYELHPRAAVRTAGLYTGLDEARLKEAIPSGVLPRLAYSIEALRQAHGRPSVLTEVLWAERAEQCRLQVSEP